MADKSISELVAASSIGASDLFVLEQSATAKKLTGQILINYLTAAADGHGGISSIAKTGTSGLNDTYTITYADTTTSTFVITNGAKGDKGDSYYVWIRYSGAQPTQDSDMGTTPDNWMGIYTGTSSTAPTTYTNYAWFQIKGATGATGTASSVSSQAVTYQSSTSGTTTPSGTWQATVPTVPQGYYLWTRTVITFNDGTSITIYSVGRMGVDGEGAPSDSTPLMDGVAAKGVETNYARGDHVHPSDTSRAAISDLANYESKRLQFTDTVVAKTAFVNQQTPTYEDFPYRAAIALTGVLATMTPEVVLSVADAMSGNFAPVSECYAGGVYIYAATAPESAITIPTIIVLKAVL